MRKTYLPIIAFAITLFSACGSQSEKKQIPNTDDPVPVKLVKLQKTKTNPVIATSGQFTTKQETYLSFKTGGLIDKIYVKEGDRIRKGQLLATLDLTEISAQVRQARLAYEKTERDFKRVENLFRDSVVSLEQLENAKTGFDMAKQSLTAATFNLSLSEIRAATDGVVLKKLANPGQMTAPGTPVILTDSKGNVDWILRVAVSDREWAAISLNDKAVITADAFPMKNLEAFVFGKSENTDERTGSFTIDLKLKNTKNLNVASGMFGKAEIFTSQTATNWEIPYEAFLDGNQNEGFVFITRDKKFASKVKVTVDRIEKDKIIVNKGLDSAIYLITSGSAYLTDGTEIKVN